MKHTAPQTSATAVPPCPARLNLARHVLRRAAQMGDKPALQVIGADTPPPLGFAELEDNVLRLCGALRASGMAPGSRVLLRLANTPDFPLAYLACIAAGLVPVPTSSQLTAPEITRLSAIVQPSLILAADEISLPTHYTGPIWAEADIASAQSAPRGTYADTRADDPAYIVFTSGTSGTPRAVVHGHRAIWARQYMHDGWYGLREGDRMLHAGAFNWTYTLGTGLMDPWSVGATALIPAPGTDSRDLPDLIASSHATLFAAAPGVYRQILRGAIPDLPALRHGLSAGEKLPAPVRDAFRSATGRDVHEAFGMSECSTFLSGNPQRPAPVGTLGYPQPGRKIALLDPETHTPVADNTPGIIAVHADEPGLMLGYRDAPEDTAARYTPDKQWFLTGDLAQCDDTGAYRYLGRSDDMMNAGGYRVSPLEVETILTAHPSLSEVAVTEVPVKANTTVIAAFYTGPKPISDTALAAFASQRLARYKCPKIFIHLDALPRGANGKLLRRALRQRFEATHG